MNREELAESLGGIYGGFSCEIERVINAFDTLEKQNKFLMERENKLQLIETMFKNEPIDLKELSKFVRGE